ncbi:MAG: hypothetical protein MK212_10975 [Saprospiraceae bacterium]|nr:hypothetical protein [Saprospiraceae bacterium]
MENLHSYYLLEYNSLVSYENTIRAIYPNLDSIIKALEIVINIPDHLPELLTQTTQISIALVTENEEQQIIMKQSISVYPFLTIEMQNVLFSYWHELEDGDEIEVNFPEAFIVSFDPKAKTIVDGDINTSNIEMYLWNLDNSPLSLPHIPSQSITKVQDEAIKYIFEDLIENQWDSDFEDLETSIFIDPKLQDFIPDSNQSMLKQDNVETHYGFLGININGEFSTDSLAEFRDQFLT